MLKETLTLEELNIRGGKRGGNKKWSCSGTTGRHDLVIPKGSHKLAYELSGIVAEKVHLVWIRIIQSMRVITSDPIQ